MEEKFKIEEKVNVVCETDYLEYFLQEITISVFDLKSSCYLSFLCNYLSN